MHRHPIFSKQCTSSLSLHQRCIVSPIFHNRCTATLFFSEKMYGKFFVSKLMHSQPVLFQKNAPSFYFFKIDAPSTFKIDAP